MKFEVKDIGEGHYQWHFEDGTICDQAPGGPVTCRLGDSGGAYLAAIAMSRNPDTKYSPAQFTAADVQRMVDAAVKKATAPAVE